MKQQLLSFGIILVSIYKIVTSFTQNLEHGMLFSVQTNIWVYRVIWIVAGSLSAYAIFKIYKDKRHYGRKQ